MQSVRLGLVFLAAWCLLPPYLIHAESTTICMAGRCETIEHYRPPAPSPSIPSPSLRSEPTEPSTEERERDRKTALDEALEKGHLYYDNGEYAQALKYFEEALEYSPHHPNILFNIQAARSKLASRQLRSIEQNSTRADSLSLEPGKKQESGMGFDTPSTIDGGSIVVPSVPAVPGWVARHPRYQQLQHDLTKLEQQQGQLANELKQLNERRLQTSNTTERGQIELQIVQKKDQWNKTDSKVASQRGKLGDFSIDLQKAAQRLQGPASVNPK